MPALVEILGGLKRALTVPKEEEGQELVPQKIPVVRPGNIGASLGSGAVAVSASERLVRDGRGRKFVEARIAAQSPPGPNPLAFVQVEGRAPANQIGEHQVTATLQGIVWSGRSAASASLSERTILVPVPKKEE